MMNTSTTSTMTRFRYAATLAGALAALVLAPATAFAADNDPSGPAGPGGCYYTDEDGYDIPIHDGEDIFIDGRIVSCRGGKIVITTAPLGGVGTAQPPWVNENAPVVNEPPMKSPVLTWTVPVMAAQS